MCVADVDARQRVDLIIRARYVCLVRPAAVLEHTSIVIDQGRIVDLLNNDDERLRKYAPGSVEDLSRSHIVLPGLINAHTHLGMTNMRGLADDLRLIDWLAKHVWPVELSLVDEQFCRDGADLGIAEAIRSGTTCVNDMYFFPEATAASCDAAGIRAIVSGAVFDFPSPYGSGPEEYRTKGHKLHKQYAAHDRIRTAASAHAPYTCSDCVLETVAQDSTAFSIPIHVHLHETRAEVEDSHTLNRDSHLCHRSDQTCRPLANFHRLGLVTRRLVAVHMTHLNDQEIDLLRQCNSSVVHCPSSNLKLASGFCPAYKLLAAGVNVALGTDSSCSNNRLDMFAEMKLAALLAKGLSDDPSAIPAQTALEMATINGAKALGIENNVGSIECGKVADLIAVDSDCIGMTPMFDVVSHLVYAATGANVTHSWVNGKPILRGGHLLTLDESSIKARSTVWRKKIIEVQRQASNEVPVA
ncbi:Amidohydrolase-related domain-containing protein [Plasmodiophora brassicae]